MNRIMSQKAIHPQFTQGSRATTFTGERSEMNINWHNHRTDNSITYRDLFTIFQSVFRWNVCLAITIGCAAVYTVGRLTMKWDSDLSVVQFGILFPMVFVLTQAYNRRESCLNYLAGFKSSIYSLYWIHRDWALADDDTPAEHKIRHIENTYNTLMELVCNFRCFLQTTHHTPSHHVDCYHDQVYKCISQLTVLGRQSFLDECINEASLFRYEVMRQKLVENVEKIRVLRDYRTPRTLMFMTTFFLYLGCFVLAPYFNSYCENTDDHACSAAYFMAIAYALVLFNIHNVVGDLESSFDHMGVDDIHFSIREHLSRLHHGLPAAFFKHDSQGNYVIQSAKRFKSTNGVLSLDKAELDLYTDMCLRSKYLSHEEVFEPDYQNVSSKITRPHNDKPVSLRVFGRKIFGEENIVEVNKFTRRTQKQEFLTENDMKMRGALTRELTNILKQKVVNRDEVVDHFTNLQRTKSTEYHNIVEDTDSF